MLALVDVILPQRLGYNAHPATNSDLLKFHRRRRNTSTSTGLMITKEAMHPTTTSAFRQP